MSKRRESCCAVALDCTLPLRATLPLALRQTELDKAATEIGSEVPAIQGDVTRLEDLERVYAQIREKHGRVDT